MTHAPIFTDDTIVFGLLMLALGIIFYTDSRTSGFWHKFYKIVPSLFVAYFVPAIFTTAGLTALATQTVITTRHGIAARPAPMVTASRTPWPTWPCGTTRQISGRARITNCHRLPVESTRIRHNTW